MSKLIIKDRFLYNDEELQIISGAIHYFRVVPEYWEDRLLKLKACGFNTLETYVPWNFHEPEPGKFVFSGRHNLEKFIEIAAEIGLFVILRPSPYICAEWEFGGLPAWLLRDPNIKLRTSSKSYLSKIDSYYDELIPKIEPLLSTNGGPIIAIQIENEYGSYGNDKEYLKYLKEALEKRGIDVPLFTSDGPTDSMLLGGSLNKVYKTVNFGSKVEKSFNKLKEYQSNKPLMCMEYWNGWFDHWGKKHHIRNEEETASLFKEMLEMGASVNFYMFHGGSNFAFYNGANCFDKYEPTTTSYDYNAPLNEAGDLTEKYYAIQDVLSDYVEVNKSILPKPTPKKAYGKVKLTESAKLFDVLNQISEPIKRKNPETMESLGQNYGFVLYRTYLSGPLGKKQLVLQDVHDRALVFIDKVFAGVIYRNDKKQSLDININNDNVCLDILVENMGRINYGPYLKDFKGITEGVRIDSQFLFDWEIYPLPLKNINKLKFEGNKLIEGPTFYKGTFTVKDKADTYVKINKWKKGIIFINGFNLGRYWEIGPQKTLYMPAPLLKEGKNEIVLFELHNENKNEIFIELVDKPLYE